MSGGPRRKIRVRIKSRDANDAKLLLDDCGLVIQEAGNDANVEIIVDSTDGSSDQYKADKPMETEVNRETGEALDAQNEAYQAAEDQQPTTGESASDTGATEAKDGGAQGVKSAGERLRQCVKDLKLAGWIITASVKAKDWIINEIMKMI